MKSARLLSIAGVVAVAATLAGCTGDGSGESMQPARSDDSRRGPITYVQGPDDTGTVSAIVDRWNSTHPDEKVTFRPQSADFAEQYDDLVQHFQKKDPGYDVVDVDVVWTAEFAEKGWLQPLTGKYAMDMSGFLAPTVEAGAYDGTQYTAPLTSNGGLLYYRKDLAPTPPRTWDEMMRSCDVAAARGIGCYAGQYAVQEGLAVNVAEAINTDGGSFFSDDGKTVTVDSAESAAGLERLVAGLRGGQIPAAALTYDAGRSRQAFEAGQLMYMRDWPEEYNSVTTGSASTVKDVVGIASLPGVRADRPGVSSLGGHNAAISAYSENKDTAYDFLAFLQTAEIQKMFLLQGSLAPVLTSAYSDPGLIAQRPFLPLLKQSILTALPRPVSPHYQGISTAIQENSFAALSGKKSTSQALKDMAAEMKAAVGDG